MSTGCTKRLASSFRDPSGFLFDRDGVLYRQITIGYKDHYDLCNRSGLYHALMKKGMLIPHEEVEIPPETQEGSYKIIRPERIPFISYPYEWCFSQLKGAALLTLHIQKLSLEHGMSLKDASAYNVQFRHGQPVFIDTLSFEQYREGYPWIAYRQFCQHFLAPLVLMSFTDIRLNQLLRIYIDGVPLDLASKLLPFGTWFRLSTLLHIHLHAKSQARYADKHVEPVHRKVTKTALLGIISSLEASIAKLQWRPVGTEWGAYYEDTNYSPEALADKKRIVGEYLGRIQPQSVWDLGANTGLFSRLAAERGIPTVAFDIDPAAVEKHYQQIIGSGLQGKAGAAMMPTIGVPSQTRLAASMLPLCLDLSNPSAGIGWGGNERMSFQDRGPAHTILALAIVHHLAISNNLPFQKIACFFSKLCRYLIIEFVAKSDSQVQKMLTTREDIFLRYTREVFEETFKKYFSIVSINQIKDSERILYAMKNLS